MKFRLPTLVLLFAVIPVCVVGKAENDKRNRRSDLQKTERTMAVDPAVAITLCVASGSVGVQGWDKPEILVRSVDGAEIQLKRSDKAAPAQPATKIDVSLLDKDDQLRRTNDCQATGDLELNVPRGATVQVQTTDGNISMSDVATAYAQTQDGQVSLERISRSVDVGSIGGDLFVSNSSGRIDLTTVSGNIQVSGVRASDPSETFEITTVSGDIELTQVAHSQLSVRTVNGDVHLTGPLAHNGRYGVNTMSGDVTFAMPANASFQLEAKVSSHGDVISDFPLTLTSQTVSVAKPVQATPESPATPSEKGGKVKSVNAAPPTPTAGEEGTPTPPNTNIDVPIKKVMKIEAINIAPHTLRRIHAVCGSGDAAISVASFSGTLRLEKN